MIFKDSRHAIAKANNTRQIPAAVINPTGTSNVHFKIPSVQKNNDSSLLILMQPIVSPTAAEIIIAGIKDNDVCKISCLVVKPKDFKIP